MTRKREGALPVVQVTTLPFFAFGLRLTHLCNGAWFPLMYKR